jgi:hypothetical protein
LGGCSQDQHVYRSTALAPKAVSIISYETGKTLWSMNIPVGQQLHLDFSRKNKGGEVYRSPNIPADKVKWTLYSLDAMPEYGGHKMKGGKRIKGDTVKLPGEAIGIEVSLIDQETAASAQ